MRVSSFKTAYVDGWLLVAQTGGELREVRSSEGMASAISALLVGGFCMVWLSRRVRRELGPLSEMTSALAQYDPLDSRQSLPEQHRQELAAIRAAVLDLGQRLAQRVANERAFRAHAAHALRTPLAGMEAQLAMALREAPEGQRAQLQRTREATDRLRRVVTALLTLFRAGMSLQWQVLEVSELLGHLTPPDGLVLELPGEGRVQADPDLLAAALINLLDNAWRHRATRLVLRLRTTGEGGCRLDLQDDGEGVSADKRDALNEALACQQYEGRMGLGLMMAHLVARAHGGDLSLPPVASGFAVSMRRGPPPDRLAATADPAPGPPIGAPRGPPSEGHRRRLHHGSQRHLRYQRHRREMTKQASGEAPGLRLVSGRQGRGD